MTEKELALLADFYRLFGNVTRLKIVWELSKRELCVSELVEKLNISQPSVSSHLKELRYNRAVVSEKRGRVIFYRLADAHIASLVEAGVQHIRRENCYDTHS